MDRSHVGRKSTAHLTDNSQSLKCLNVIDRSIRTDSNFEMSGFVLLQCQNLKASTIQSKDPTEVYWLRKFKVYLNCQEKQNNSKTTTTKTISKTQPEKTRLQWETSGRSRDRSELLKNNNNCFFLFLFICMYVGVLFFHIDLFILGFRKDAKIQPPLKQPYRNLKETKENQKGWPERQLHGC